ncbi:helix-turn-helix domain-containing protein [Lactococcus petauri]|uniref:helix-turn-helix domain-containing protein n=1 Tax=Lactococcus petauri TaxID=1940789 RepID=UPI00385242F8
MLLPISRQKDLEVLYLLCTSEKLSYPLIEKKINLSLRTIRNIVKRLNISIEDKFQIKDFILSSNKGEVYISSQYLATKFDILFKLRLEWYKESPSTRLISTIFSSYDKTYDEIAKILFLSPAGLRKVISKTNEYLHHFKFQIRTRNGRLSFEGDEMKIRIFLFQFFSHTFYNIEWPFESEELNKIKEILPLDSLPNVVKQSSIKVQSYYLLIHILKNRFTQDQFISLKLSNSDLDIFSYFYSEDNSSLSEISIFKNLPEVEKKNEVFIVEFCLRMYIPEIDSENLQIHFGEFFEKSNNDTAILATSLVNILDNKFFRETGSSSNKLRIYQVTLFLLFFKYIGETIAPFLYMYFPKPTYHLYTEDKFMNTIKNTIYSLIKDQSTTFQNYISSFLYSLYRPQIQNKVYIYLEFFKDNAADYYIKKRIHTIFNPEHIVFTSKMDECDLIVTDTFDIKKDKDKLFYLSGTNDEKGWRDLLKDIQIISTNKILNAQHF